jgi:hypothetical protein
MKSQHDLNDTAWQSERQFYQRIMAYMDRVKRPLIRNGPAAERRDPIENFRSLRARRPA